jgi:MSHA biogenesis protein MshN
MGVVRMSVINQMLLDLERRRASGEERNRIPDHVRALPGGDAGPGMPAPALIIAAVLVVLAAAGSALWWWQNRSAETLPAVVQPAKPADPGQSPAEGVAQRMSLDLAGVPSRIDAPADASAPAGISTQSVIVSEPPSWAREPGEPPVAEGSALRKPAVAATDIPAPAAVKPAAEAALPKVMKPVATVPSAGINKRVREQTPRQRADAEYARGVGVLHQGRATEAQSAFEAAVQIDPAHHSARQALAGVLIDAGQPAEAMRKLEEGLQISPAQFGFAMMLARLQVDRGELDAGVQTLSRSAEYAGGSAEYAAFHAGLLQRQQKHTEAVELFIRALRQRPNTGVWLLGMGISLEALSRNADAKESFRRARESGNLPPDLQAFADQRAR